MECNLGKTERRIRVFLGVVLLGIAGLTMLPEWGSGLAFVLGIVALFSGVARFCPLWKVFGINTCERKHAESH